MINAAAFKESILCAYAALQANVQAINDLNVFPVPDGDTGTNMGLTMERAATELRKKDFDTVAAAADCVASALLRAARGNSGVILSLLFRGISKKMKGLHECDAKTFAAAMQEGVGAAYKAVMKPAEGTILTVSRLASEAAAANADAGLEASLQAAIAAGDEALADTINLNPVLKKAGVVDAGGMGYMVILKAIFASLRGEIVAPQDQIRIEEIMAESEKTQRVFEKEGVQDVITFAFDTVYVVRKREPEVDLEPLRAYLGSIGDSLVISEDDEIFKVHVHTDTPGDALNESQKYGVLELAKIENMVTQAEQQKTGGHVISTDDLDRIEKELEEPEIAAPEKQFGAVVVAAGAGMQNLFRELGADRVVTGGQTMNPSTDDILREINLTPAETVFVLPNNKNIIMAAEATTELCKDKRVIVIPTKTVPQGISALLNFNIDENEEPLVEAMKEAAANVHTAMVTYAARDSDFDGHQIHAGEYLALMDGKLIGSYSSEKTLLKELSWAFDEYSPEFITVYYGQDVSEEDAQAAADSIGGCFPDAEMSVVNGGQPVYYYMISVE